MNESENSNTAENKLYLIGKPVKRWSVRDCLKDAISITVKTTGTGKLENI